jgi:uncharacterized tellurite resistance protein B-like protein
MLKRFIRLLKGDLEAEGSEHGPFERRVIAVAALLIEAMHVDHEASPMEAQAIARLLRRHFGLREERVAELIAVAEQRYAEVLDDWEFVQAVRRGFTPGEQCEILTMLWEVAYADGRLLKLEDRLIERLVKQLRLPADVAETARIEAVSRAGLMPLREGGQ